MAKTAPKQRSCHSAKILQDSQQERPHISVRSHSVIPPTKLRSKLQGCKVASIALFVYTAAAAAATTAATAAVEAAAALG